MQTLTMETSSEFESDVLDVIKYRKSKRAYSSRAVEPEKIKSLFEAARWAPSSMNDQPWTYLYATKDQPELWNKLFDALNDSNKVWAKEAPLLVVSLARKYFSVNGKPNGSARYDLGSANAFLTLQATALDLNIHQMGGYNHEKLIVNLNIPDHYELGVIMAIGYWGDPEALPENLKQRELAPRQRHVQREFVMNNTF
ncbi:MAG: nitroreductase family protein [Cyclobacteriaceae bacterium]|nr:nitroreductase family protein [Cyclobacteriaceae bacterium]